MKLLSLDTYKSVLATLICCTEINLGLWIFLLVIVMSVMAVGLGCSNMKVCIFDKWCRYRVMHLSLNKACYLLIAIFIGRWQYIADAV